jgi:hypothetical protein
MLGSMISKNKISVEESATIVLSETTTQILLAIPSFLQASDVREVMFTEERNSRYEQSVKAHANADGFSSRFSQTKNNPQKHQNETAAANTVRECGAQCVSYEIKDELLRLSQSLSLATLSEHETTVGVNTEDEHSLSISVRHFVDQTVNVVLVTPGCLLDTTTALKPIAPTDRFTATNTAASVSKGQKSRVGGNFSTVGNIANNTRTINSNTHNSESENKSTGNVNRENDEEGSNDVSQSHSQSQSQSQLQSHMDSDVDDRERGKKLVF